MTNLRYKVKLKELLKETKTSQRELARKLDTDVMVINRACREIQPSITETHLKIADYFGEDIKDWFDVIID
ncbi:hypothetical protein [Coleofasciculus sp. E2-BRE-01]|uniref:hypothetical protein n=1 Tax=Coleofasciculus sp. E2-BRE-01 TaxID=3069524 RepID=UPI0032F32CB8